MIMNIFILYFILIIFSGVCAINLEEQHEAAVRLGDHYDYLIRHDDRPRKRLLQQTINMKSKMEAYQHSNERVVGFYHIYANGKYQEIVNEQLEAISKSGLYDQMDLIFYNTIVVDYNITMKKYVHLSHLGETGGEVDTLSSLYEYCHDHPQTKVFYFHDKGSFHQTYLNDMFRYYMNCYVLSPNCISALDSFDTCGMRASPAPFPHYSGNFWWARCDYVNKLVDPMSLVTNETFRDLTASLSKCIGSEPRYFAEAWIGSAPKWRPADCVDAEVDTTWLFGYGLPGTFNVNCPNPEGNYGSKCGLAQTWRNPELFSAAHDHMRELELKACNEVSLKKEVEKRTQYWYGQNPQTYDQWIELIMKPLNLVEGSVIRGIREVQCYYFTKGEIRAIPSADILFKLGKSFDDIIAVPTYQIYRLKRGEPIDYSYFASPLA